MATFAARLRLSAAFVLLMLLSSCAAQSERSIHPVGPSATPDVAVFVDQVDAARQTRAATRRANADVLPDDLAFADGAADVDVDLLGEPDGPEVDDGDGLFDDPPPAADAADSPPIASEASGRSAGVADGVEDLQVLDPDQTSVSSEVDQPSEDDSASSDSDYSSQPTN